MTVLDVYLIGVLISFVIACSRLFIEYKNNEQIVLSDIVGFIFWTIFSWFTIMMCIMYILGEVFNWFVSNGDNIIIYKRKSKKK